ncbi:acetyl-CoA carboxylase biotin carboxyl carrier protein [Mesobacillus maritimus]|uniref:acetyl-CoA carboxylase biotin carboxyl carrier protein n=1 Tax=Mesobacillus maritimus TaxID=1643336 RepID=UPI00203B78EE|nr:acetyl-CoA carboxylase biotin carboxyl carrier protein [Mesobacillus maritimus]MCM3586380.1 acetyl-CoA carboxylase biotin carboxyl carrier protein [Mesobacillus maritimus]MCM3669588.1 acetyl-CoA carboxylase biotin carboxyl carrier protein [Mesobacillus maritimus]
MLKVQEIRELIKLVDQSSIEEFTYENEGSKIKMKKNAGKQVVVEPARVVQETPVAPQAVQVATPAPTPEVQVESPKLGTQEVNAQEEANLHKITSPMVGTFYQSPSPDADAYVKPGSKVNKNSVVCIVEAMKLFNEIEAEVDGEIVEILVKDGQLVEYGQPLFLVKPE